MFKDHTIKGTAQAIHFVFKLSVTMPLCSCLLRLGGGCTASKILQEQTCHFAEGMLHWNYAYEYNKWQFVSTLLPLRSRLISKVGASTEPVWPWSTRHEDTYNNRQREVGQQAQRQQVGQVQRESESALALCTCLKGHTIPLQGTHSSVKVSQR